MFASYSFSLSQIAVRTDVSNLRTMTGRHLGSDRAERTTSCVPPAKIAHPKGVLTEETLACPVTLSVTDNFTVWGERMSIRAAPPKTAILSRPLVSGSI